MQSPPFLFVELTDSINLFKTYKGFTNVYFFTLNFYISIITDQ